ncbi:MAG: bacterioferritin-associated ferredoxin [Halopseudomonas yangmingensis]|uniref:Bacterioferritin-associated ferredoxin n=1 Tax=Halopseudomonas yangmingensis TaxID=1720063 RepID=A0A1I4Q0L4_9GAMM|nr:bacterioferritin-associated ferredoxin [Halopseudomonas yangmingensis]SFM33612.1 bacterioferritin-associated ferredoxin [Halopseudomonas yangmingensis]
MYVCLCKGVTDSQIRAAIHNGADSMRELRDALEVGTQCGKCARTCKSLLKDSRPAHSEHFGGAQWVAA